jgi:hypothetical protein
MSCEVRNRRTSAFSRRVVSVASKPSGEARAADAQRSADLTADRAER